MDLYCRNKLQRETFYRGKLLLILLNNVISRTFVHTLYFCVSTSTDNPLMFVLMYLENSVVEVRMVCSFRIPFLIVEGYIQTYGI